MSDPPRRGQSRPDRDPRGDGHQRDTPDGGPSRPTTEPSDGDGAVEGEDPGEGAVWLLWDYGHLAGIYTDSPAGREAADHDRARLCAGARAADSKCDGSGVHLTRRRLRSAPQWTSEPPDASFGIDLDSDFAPVDDVRAALEALLAPSSSDDE